MDTYAYLIGTGMLLGVWLLLYFLRKSARKKMMRVSIFTAVLGLTEPLFVPSYWSPPTLFQLARTTRFDVESILFSFAVGGVASVLHEIIWGRYRRPVSPEELRQPRHRFHTLALISPVIAFLFLYIFTPINPIYTSIIAMTVGTLATWLCRPDLLRAMITGGIVFLLLYFAVFFVGFVLLFPGYVAAVWNLPAVSGILVAGVPLEELLFAASIGAMWSSIYEHFRWYAFS